MGWSNRISGFPRRLNEREAEGLVDSFYEEISLALESGESVNLAGFGTFKKDAFRPSEKLKR